MTSNKKKPVFHLEIVIRNMVGYDGENKDSELYLFFAGNF